MFEKSIQRLGADFGLLWTRVTVAGLVFVGHGMGKIEQLGNLGSPELAFADPIGLGPQASLVLSTFAEGLCAVLLVLGLATRLAAIPLAINMGVAAFGFHASDPTFITSGFPSKEPALLYGCVFVGLILLGPGRFSADHFVVPGLKRRREKKKEKQKKEAKKNG